MRIPALACLLFLVAANASADPIASGAIQVIDGDTITAGGQSIGLLGFDTPEADMNADCEPERTLAVKATAKLRQLVTNGDLDLSLVGCSCPAGTEGTQVCNYGRVCGVLKAAGKDVATLLIADGLAKPYQCSGDQCPRKGPWC
jgi:endonuclease YncB( thermonuclease family)